MRDPQDTDYYRSLEWDGAPAPELRQEMELDELVREGGKLLWLELFGISDPDHETNNK